MQARLKLSKKPMTPVTRADFEEESRLDRFAGDSHAKQQ